MLRKIKEDRTFFWPDWLDEPTWGLKMSEQRVLVFLLAHYDPEEGLLDQYVAKVGDLAELVGQPGSAYGTVEEALPAIEKTGAILSPRYIRGEGAVKFSINPFCVPVPIEK
jgi:hypothetical protein